MTPEDAREFSQSLGQIGEGWFRQVALGVKLKVPQALGLTRGEWCGTFKVSMRDAGDRLKAEREMLEADPEISNRAMGDVLGVDESTIREDLSAGNPAPEDSAAEDEEEDAAGNPAPEDSTFTQDKIEEINHWAGARNMVDILETIDIPVSRACELAEYVHTRLEPKYRKKVTPPRARHGAAFLSAFADELDRIKNEV